MLSIFSLNNQVESTAVPFRHLQGMPFSPDNEGQIVEAGHCKVSVMRNPVVTIISIDDEVIAPGNPISKGKVYTSNNTTLAAWLYILYQVTTFIWRIQHVSVHYIGIKISKAVLHHINISNFNDYF